MSSRDAAVPFDETPQRFPSLDMLRAAHRALLQRQRSDDSAGAFLAEVQAFIQRAQATGALLLSNADRQVSQSLLDYWVAVLYRASQEPPDATLAEFDLALTRELADSRCPYPGLKAFSPGQQQLFFGRQELIDELVGKLQATRLLAVIGPAGSGKSSLVRAGLLPRLREHVGPQRESWHCYGPMVPGSNPLANLARLLQAAGLQAPEGINGQVKSFQHNLDYLAQLIGASNQKSVVLVVDQFEEVFTLCYDDRIRHAFIGNLLRLIRRQGARHAVILSMRSEYQSDIGRLPVEFQSSFAQSQVYVGPLTPDDLRAAIEKPAAVAELHFQDGIVDALVSELRGEPAGLSLLQFILSNLWDNRKHNWIMLDDYYPLRGGRQALVRQAEAWYEALEPADQEVAQRLVLRLVRPEAGREVTSNRVPHETLYHIGISREKVERVLAALIQTRLVRLIEGDIPDDHQIEPVHVALIRHWSALRNWLQEAWEALRRRWSLTDDAERWLERKKAPGALLRGQRLKEALGYTDLNQLESDFVQASQSRKRHRIVTLSAVALAVLAVLGWDWYKDQQAKRQNALARAFATASIDSLANSQRSVLLALCAVSATYPGYQVNPKAEEALHWSMQTLGAAFSRAKLLGGHTESVNGIAFSSDGTLLATASTDQTVKLWDPRSGQLQQTLTGLVGHTAQVFRVAFNPQETLLATTSADQTVRLWDPLSGELQRILAGPDGFTHTAAVIGVAFNPEGTLLATASADKTVKLWDPHSGQLQRTLAGSTGHTEEVIGVAFNPEGTLLATASADKTVKLWDPHSGQLQRTLAGPDGLVFTHTAAVIGVAFNPAGTLLATVSADKIVKLWDPHSGQLQGTPIEQPAPITAIAFSPDGSSLATASADKTVKLWDVQSLNLQCSWESHTTTVTSVAFSPTQLNLLATASADKIVKVWKAQCQNSTPLHTLPMAFRLIDAHFDLNGALRAVTVLADNTVEMWDVGKMSLAEHIPVSPDARIIGGSFIAETPFVVTVAADNTVWGWDLPTHNRRPRFTLPPQNSAVTSVVSNRTGTHLATLSEDRTVKLWELQSHTVTEKRTLDRSHTEFVISAALNSEGTLLATANADKTAKLWDVQSGQLLSILEGHLAPVTAVVFGPTDTHLLATASADKTAKLWDVQSRKLRHTLDGHLAPVTTIVFGPTGTPLLATASDDRTAKVWDMQSGRLLHTLAGHTDSVIAVSFSPDAKFLATASTDKMVRKYALDIKDAIDITRQLMQHYSWSWSAEECPYYLSQRLGVQLPAR